MGGIIFSIIMCAMFHVICDPPFWATVGICIIMCVQYATIYTITGIIRECANVE